MFLECENSRRKERGRRRAASRSHVSSICFCADGVVILNNRDGCEIQVMARFYREEEK